MKTFTLKAITLSVCLLVLGIAAQAQDKKKGETITTTPKLVVAKLKVSDGETFDVRGKASFTLTAANADDSLAGTIVYTLPEDARAKIAALTGKPLAQVPQSVTQTDVVAQYQKLTECPVIHLDFSAMDVVVLGAKIHFNRYVLDINDGGRPIHMMICKTAEQIKRGLPRRGPIRRINEIINGEEPQ
jgi:predicted RecA/RadA family phage recombinase